MSGWLSCLAGSRCFLLSSTDLGHSLPKDSILELLSRTRQGSVSLEVIPIWVICAQPPGFWQYFLLQDLYFVAWLAGWLAGWLCLVLCLAGYLAWLAVDVGFSGSNTNLGHFRPTSWFLALYLLRQDLYLVGRLAGCACVRVSGWLSCLAGFRCFLLSSTDLGHSLQKDSFFGITF